MDITILLLIKQYFQQPRQKKLFDNDVPLKSVSNPAASNLKHSCAEAVGYNNGNIGSIEIIDFTPE